jgi:hypothetical protein
MPSDKGLALNSPARWIMKPTSLKLDRYINMTRVKQKASNCMECKYPLA